MIKTVFGFWFFSKREKLKASLLQKLKTKNPKLLLEYLHGH
jgi:hypothetical protein